ncbi:NAD-dependent epimerase/dehydratase family protein [Pseudoroseicyclus aestuarii]|uniref:2'-hydroxyisoflavone reductase n=1 Tax=Pseudoroseicyclus aestuarii TaxID=1795041 RepID=A0A318SM49_9RHOB|nr:NAD-dependent epimerase/dehydratase family protein [Pseudoroseicyclus aestuarii]PYE80601.1 2'-hydroxyisoflavone reductase [Pseudoroseicyclus aestuarii]
MKSLVLGGTGFLGGAIVDALATRRHRVAVLSRGATARALPAGVELIRADRHLDLSVLGARSFDWVFDTCAYTPDAVHAVLGALDGRIKRYVLASSLSVYGRYDAPGLAETQAVPDAGPADFARAAEVPSEKRASAMAYGPSYGPLKRACEKVAEEHLGDRATILRIGLIVGAGDYTDRLTWWVRRFDMAGKTKGRLVPAPAPRERPVQVLDVYDAAAFAVRCAETDLGGVWNVAGRPMPMSDLLDAICAATGSAGEARWLPPAAFEAANAAPWTDVPLMAPDGPTFRYFLEVDASRARAAGLTARPLADTLRLLVDWDRSRRDMSLTCGMSAEHEERLLLTEPQTRDVPKP